MVLAKLAAFTGNAGYSDAAEAALASLRAEMAQAPLGFASWLSALDFVLSEPSELAIVGPDALPMLRLVRSAYRPNLVVAAAWAMTTSARLGQPTANSSEERPGPATSGMSRAGVGSRMWMAQPHYSRRETNRAKFPRAREPGPYVTGARAAFPSPSSQCVYALSPP